jgi:hypothetical protein
LSGEILKKNSLQNLKSILNLFLNFILKKKKKKKKKKRPGTSQKPKPTNTGSNLPNQETNQTLFQLQHHTTATADLIQNLLIVSK